MKKEDAKKEELKDEEILNNEELLDEEDLDEDEFEDDEDEELDDDEKEAERIREALSKGDYEVTFEEPNNIVLCTHPDGTEFYTTRDDDARFGCDAGSCTVIVLDHVYTCHFSTGEWEGDELLELVQDDLEDADGVWSGERDDLDSVFELYAKCNNLDYHKLEYYYYDDDDCPPDVDDLDTVDSWDGVTPLDYNGKTYYVLDDLDSIDILDDDVVVKYAVDKDAEMDNWGSYPLVAVKIQEGETDTILEVKETDERVDRYGELE